MHEGFVDPLAIVLQSNQGLRNLLKNKLLDSIDLKEFLARSTMADNHLKVNHLVQTWELTVAILIRDVGV